MFQPKDYQDLYNQMQALVPNESAPAHQFISHFGDKLRQYYALIEQSILPSGIDRTKLLDFIQHLNADLLDSVELTYAGRPAQAYASIGRVAKRIKSNTRQIPQGQSLYRMRRVENSKEKRTMDYVGMFHIPFSLRSIVLPQRYSMPGYPCLYLGESIFACWEELGRPNLDSCMVSRVENQEPFVVWDLRIPDFQDWQNEKLLLNCLKRFPLVIACTFRTYDEKAIFKPEYIVPQLLLELLQDNRDIHGIEYTSIHWERNQTETEVRPLLDLGFNKSYYSNIIVPVQDVTNGTAHCPNLCRIFHITNPTCEEYERIQPAAIKAEGSASTADPYKLSLFGRLEEKLLHTPTNRIIEQAPLRVFDRMIEASKVFKTRYSDPIKPAIAYMREKDYSHTPIVDQDQVVGVFSENTAFKVFVANIESPFSQVTTFNDINEYVRLDAASQDYLYVKPQDLMSDVRRRFEEERHKNDRMDLILVTSDGTKAGSFCGILTSYDLIVR